MTEGINNGTISYSLQVDPLIYVHHHRMHHHHHLYEFIHHHHLSSTGSDRDHQAQRLPHLHSMADGGVAPTHDRFPQGTLRTYLP
jgi:hypothetical protein